MMLLFQNYKYIIGLVFLLSGCGIRPGSRGVSSDIKESLIRGVFIQAYQPIRNPVFINDTIDFQVKEAWVEKSWDYGKIENITDVQDGYQLCMNSSERSVTKYGELWTFENSFTESLRVTDIRSLMGDLDKLPNSDTLSYKIVEGAPLMSDSLKVIGYFVLVKKTEPSSR